jgi:hypothetical protein
VKRQQVRPRDQPPDRQGPQSGMLGADEVIQ